MTEAGGGKSMTSVVTNSGLAGGMTTEVGRVFHYFSRLQVGAVNVHPGCTIKKGDTLELTKPSGTTFRIQVTSMERSHEPVTEATGQIGVGIWVGQWVRRHSPVLLVTPEKE
ncbi:MAG: hypothetical protein V1719_02595 [Patescibacteria group bacterium]